MKTQCLSVSLQNSQSLKLLSVKKMGGNTVKECFGVMSMITHVRQKAKNIVLHDLKLVQQNTFSGFC